MAQSTGRPKQAIKRSEVIEVRVNPSEKETFKNAADLAGIPVSIWVRERLRRAAVRELENASMAIPFLMNQESN